MSVFAEQLCAYLDQSGLQFQQSDDGTAFQMCFDSDHGINRVLVLVSDDLLQILTYPPNKVVDRQRLSIAHAVVRANFGLRIGQFELDMDDGELRYRIAVPLSDQFPADETLDCLLPLGGAMIERYHPAFLSIIYGNEDVELAIKAAEL
ncbi:YbjN domain-containing protein [Roseimaritima sediminicola]|uniref:YbjN domain-containing protein n=1 Tax=Roseimaritima sediminicola TaxID=2662066 RepID=UPI00129826AE|nr:YbjN domain-containing protein [Roseimaritima sediminicola]